MSLYPYAQRDILAVISQLLYRFSGLRKISMPSSLRLSLLSNLKRDGFSIYYHINEQKSPLLATENVQNDPLQITIPYKKSFLNKYKKSETR